LFGCIVAARTASAQTITVTAKSTDDLRDQLRALVNQTDPNSGKPVLEALDKLDDPKTLKGLDRSKVLGAFADIPDGENPVPTAVVFLPASNATDLLESLKEFGLTVDDKGGEAGFSHRLATQTGQELFALTSAGYLFISSASKGAEKLKALKPANLRPAGATGLVASIRLDRVPRDVKETFLGQVEQNAQQQRERKSGETDAAYKNRLSGMKLVEDGVASLVHDGRELALDVDIQPTSDRLALTLEVDATPGTKTAEALKTFSARQSRFRGLAGGSAVSVRGVVPVPEAVATIIRDGLKSAREQAGKEKDDDARRMINLLLDAIEPTLTGDQLDACINIDGPFPGAKDKDEETIVVLFGVAAKESHKIEAALREAVTKAKPEDREKISLDVDKGSDGTPIHRFKIDPASLKDNPQFGAPLMFVAFPEGVALTAVGEQGLTVMKRTLDSLKGKPAAGPQLTLDVATKMIARLSKDEDREAAQAAAHDVFKGPDATKDRLQLSLGSDGTRARLRLATDLPVLRFFSRTGAAQKDKQKND
jgi:hypothetical protein